VVALWLVCWFWPDNSGTRHPYYDGYPYFLILREAQFYLAIFAIVGLIVSVIAWFRQRRISCRAGETNTLRTARCAVVVWFVALMPVILLIVWAVLESMA